MVATALGVGEESDGMSGKPWSEIELEIIKDMRKRAKRLREAADDCERKADEYERKWRDKHPGEAVVLP